jgi:hypothetical protein
MGDWERGRGEKKRKNKNEESRKKLVVVREEGGRSTRLWGWNRSATALYTVYCTVLYLRSPVPLYDEAEGFPLTKVQEDSVPRILHGTVLRLSLIPVILFVLPQFDSFSLFSTQNCSLILFSSWSDITV